MTKIWVTSDTHFGHQNVIKYSNRPWGSVEEMNDGLIELWNDRIGEHDIVYHLGDFTLTSRIELVDQWLGQLNGEIRLVKGNHDNWTRKADELTNGSKIKWIKDYYERSFTLDGNKYKVVMCHFPMLFWHGSHWGEGRGSMMLHGHCHGNAQDHNEGVRRYDVGVDCNEFAPMLLEDVMRKLVVVQEKHHHHGAD